MTELAEKEQLLKTAGYFYLPEREVYINRKTRKAFSVDYLEDHDAEEIARKIHRTERSGKWTFVFNQRPSESVKRELSKLLDA